MVVELDRADVVERICIDNTAAILCCGI